MMKHPYLICYVQDIFEDAKSETTNFHVFTLKKEDSLDKNYSVKSLKSL